MTLDKRNRRALAILAVAVPLILIARFSLSTEEQPKVVVAADSVPRAEKRLARLRQLAATAPGREEVLKRVSAELAGREKGMVQADTAAQAQAQILQILRKLARGQSPGIDIRTVEIGQVRPLGDNYGTASVAVSFECRIEQLVQFLADLTAQPEMLATEELRVQSANQKEKSVNVRLMVAGVVPRRLVPEKKGLASF